jgi:rare lipoprotein A
VVRVRSLVNGKTVDVRINDRGPFLKRRIIDLSRGAAEALGLLQSRRGVKPVAISILQPHVR